MKVKTLGTKEICIKTFGNNNTTEILEKVELRIKCLFGRTIRIVCYVKDICSPLNGQYINLASEKYKHLHNLKLADSDLRSGNMKVDVLIGADFYWSFVENTTIRGYHNDPIALKSKLGFLLSGPIFVKKVFENSETGSCVNTAHVMLVESSLSPGSLVKESMTSVWGIGEFDNSNFEVIDRFRLTIKYNETQKQYSVRLPFKIDHHPICDNYDLCIKRFKNLQKKTE